MGKKIFVSYKYYDVKVQDFPNTSKWESDTARDYVDEFENKLDDGDDIYKGESDGDSLSDLSEDAIAEKLKDRIYDSSVTVVFISKGMKEEYKTEKQQWIPWEVSYSLKEISRGGRTSLTNAVLAVVLPDENGSYEYFITRNEECGSVMLQTNFLFPIMKKNMFNVKKPTTSECNGNTLYHGLSSYINTVKWNEFIKNYKTQINIAVGIFENRDDYDISKELEG